MHKILNMDTSFISQKLESVKSLQSLCRAAVLSSVTLNRIHYVEKLGLPNVLKDFLCSFNIPQDFDLDGFYFDYHSNFPNHVHHKVHQIYPGRCLIDGAKILIKSQHLIERCRTCDLSGMSTMRSQLERDVWLRLRHENLMSCLMTVHVPLSQRMCFVFEFPAINLQDFVFRMYLLEQKIPDTLAWQVLSKLSAVFIYLEESGLIPWELCHPQNVIITNEGNVKLENLLLYLPVTSGSRYQTNTSKLFPPELAGGQHLTSKTVVWCLGRILYKMCVKLPRKGNILKNSDISPLHYNKEICSKDLFRVMCECLRASPTSRPTLLALKQRSELQMQKFRVYNWEQHLKTNLMLLRTMERIPLSKGFIKCEI